VCYATVVVVLRTGVKQNDENWMQTGSIAGCWDGEVVVSTNGFAFQLLISCQ